MAIIAITTSSSISVKAERRMAGDLPAPLGGQNRLTRTGSTAGAEPPANEEWLKITQATPPSPPTTPPGRPSAPTTSFSFSLTGVQEEGLRMLLHQFVQQANKQGSCDAERAVIC